MPKRTKPRRKTAGRSSISIGLQRDAAVDRPVRIRPAPSPLFAPAVARLGKVADSELAKQCGVSTYRIKQERQARGIGPYVARLAQGLVRNVIKTVRLTPAEEQAQLAAAAHAGASDWGTWIRDLGNAEAARLARLEASGEVLASMQAADVDRIVYPTDADPQEVERDA